MYKRQAGAPAAAANAKTPAPQAVPKAAAKEVPREAVKQPVGRAATTGAPGAAAKPAAGGATQVARARAPAPSSRTAQARTGPDYVPQPMDWPAPREPQAGDFKYKDAKGEKGAPRNGPNEKPAPQPSTTRTRIAQTESVPVP